MKVEVPDQSAILITSSRDTPPALALDVDADRVEWPLNTAVSIPALPRMDRIQRAIEHDLTGRWGLWKLIKSWLRVVGPMTGLNELVRAI